MEITATEQRYRVTVNGVLVNNFTGDRSLSGYIGLQLGRPLVQFRNIRIKELNATSPPLPVTGPTTWTDTKGRSITATFKSIQDSNVLLDIAGKITPVPMNTLSRESQNLARSYSPRSTPPIRPMTSQPTAASEFTPERFPSGLAMFGYHLPSKILNSNATSNTVSTLQKLYEACVNREIELCTTNAGRQSDLEWFVAERARVNGKVFPSGTTNPALPESLQKLQAAYWKTAVALDTVLDSKQ